MKEINNALLEHLSAYGLKYFDNDEDYFSWGGYGLGQKNSKELNKLRKPLQRGKAKPYEYRRFYEYIASPNVAAIVHSMKTCAIYETALAVTDNIGSTKTILDLGCCTGYLTTWYAKTCPMSNVIGIDFSGKSIVTAKKYKNKFELNNVEFHQLDIIS